MKNPKEIALDKIWNILIALLIGEVGIAYNYKPENLPWLILGLIAILFIIAVIFILSYQISLENKEEK